MNLSNKYKAIVTLAALSPGLAALGARAEELKCAGPFASDSSHQRLVQAFGQSNVVRETLEQEGRSSNASIVFPADPARRVQVTWRDDANRRRPSTIQPAGGWSAPKGIRIGMPLNEVESINGRPFRLSGFDWDYGGTSTSWNGGALAMLPGGCNLYVIFDQQEGVDQAASLKVAGDKEFSSDSPEIRAIRSKVLTVVVSYPDNASSRTPQ